METVIRSPQKGVVAKLVHKEGVCVLSPLVETSLTFPRTFVKQAQFLYFLKRYVTVLISL